ncbi:hypothetical protein NL676_010056 [Syzygium grande]|nr:hypothetical protein NL676_010056 [Syzygium grande]
MASSGDQRNEPDRDEPDDPLIDASPGGARAELEDSSLLWIRLVVSILASFQRSNMILDSRSLNSLIDSIFPLFRRHIEPDLHHAQSPDSFSAQVLQGNEAQTDNFIEMYLRPPSASEEA